MSCVPNVMLLVMKSLGGKKLAHSQEGYMVWLTSIHSCQVKLITLILFPGPCHINSFLLGFG